MADFTWVMFGNDEFGLGSGNNATTRSDSGGTFTAGGAGTVVTVTDDDTSLDDDTNGGGQVLDSSQQYLTSAYDGHNAGSYIQSYGTWTVTNTTTGETGFGYLIRFTTGDFPGANPNSLEGQYYRVFTIAVSPGDVLVLGSRDSVGNVPYANLFICFAAGTKVLTPDGTKLIENLRPGDLVTTFDHGDQSVRWVGSRRVAAKGKAAPVVIKRGALGNKRDLKISQQHRMLVSDWRSQLLFGENQVLVPAKSLVNHDTIYIAEGGEVEYFHILFDQHELVWAEGIITESFHPGAVGMSSLEKETRDEILALFPELGSSPRSFARPVLRPAEAALLA